MDRIDRISEEWRKERPDIDHEAMALIGRLSRITRHLKHEMEACFSAHGLSAASFDVLATLRRAGAPFQLSPGDLLNRTMVTSGTMTNRIDRLVAQGWVERRKNPDDARSFLIALTRSGFEKIDSAVSDHTANQTRLTAGLSSQERDELTGLLKRFLAEFEDPEG